MTDDPDAPVPDAGLVRELLREPFPDLADQDVRLSSASGSSNWVFRVGEDSAVRLPRSDSYTADLLTEAEFLPRLAPHLPVRVPEVRFLAEPSARFPRPWTVVSWVPGENPTTLDAPAQARLAVGLGRFMRDLHRVDTYGLPAGSKRWGYRAGEPVTDVIDGWVASAAESLADLFDPGQVQEAWRRVRDVPPASASPCWVHTDLSVENVLATPEGDLVGVLDFGGLGVGDRSVDLLYAWSMLDLPAREILFAASGADDVMRLRARAWAFAGPGLLSIAHYRHSMPERTARLTTMVEAIAEEVGVWLGRRPRPVRTVGHDGQVDHMKYWNRLVRDLDGWSSASSAGPGRIRVSVPQDSGRGRRVVIVMTPDQWVDMFSVAWGSVDAAFDNVKQTLLAMEPHEGFAVYADYRLEASTSERLPEPGGSSPEPGSGVWEPKTD